MIKYFNRFYVQDMECRNEQPISNENQVSKQTINYFGYMREFPQCMHCITDRFGTRYCRFGKNSMRISRDKLKR